ncbi:hypothetical protein GCM10011575_33310 [Microlunatus endophyticus]|uniref:Uncharacterized protein n=1 Tax=Microlunatus endophyticus TaxID=1716077 RepID=A0A917SDH7_9ACTN|nr:hypothetical protein [Microlunatus endophyticus]GGL72298.1 hypothetical protein GCM10011575_33310 [Microlunatus endophyticus]
MSVAIRWLGFLGAWLLVAGPLYQGVLELLEQDVDRAGLQSTIEGLQPPGPLDRRWWLLPPVMIVLRRRRDAEFHQQVLSRMTPEQLAERSSLIQKATGWFIVAAGALLLATKETWELAEPNEWPIWAFVAALIVMACLAGGCALLAFTHHQTLRRTLPPE